VNKIQDYRTKKFSKVGAFMLKLGFTANLVSIIGLIFGLISTYFLFSNNLVFIIFILLHLIADSLDGVIARLSKVTTLGKLMDHVVNDGTITVVLLLKIGWYLSDFYAYLSALLIGISLLVYAYSNFRAPLLFMRLYTVIALFISLSFTSITNFLLILTYLSAAVAGAYSIARQIQWCLSKTRE